MDKQNAINETKKNRMSFKQFQQHYEEQNIIEKQKRISQQEELQKLAINNLKPLQNASKDKVSFVDLSKPKKTNAMSQSKKSVESLQLNEINSLNSSIAFPSCFVSPKASTQALMKSINLASNKSKSKQLNGLQKSSSKGKLIEPKITIFPKQNTVINLNCGIQRNGSKSIPNDKQDKQKAINRISSISKMNTTDICESSLISFPSQKLLLMTENEKDDGKTQEIHKETVQYVNYLVSELNFLNQVFKELQVEHCSEIQDKRSSTLSYKSKLLGQIRAKLSKQSTMFGTHLHLQDSPIGLLHSSILTLLQNYQADIKQTPPINLHQQKPKPSKQLQIKIDDSPSKFDLQNRQQRNESKKKTIKLSKSRITHEQTLNSQSKAHPFETSEFSILNTSKITEVSRPSSQNKDFRYSNEIEHVINSKILQNYEQKERDEEQKPKYNFGNRLKVHLKSDKRSVVNQKKEESGLTKKGLFCDGANTKSVTKTISLIGGTTTKYPCVPKCTKNQKNPMKQNINTQNLSNSQANPNLQNTIILKPLQNSFHHQSHNESIFELEYLENYSSIHQQSNYPSIEPKYSHQLFR